MNAVLDNCLGNRRTVHNVMCGFEGNTPKVLCSEEEEDDEEDEEFQEEFAEEIAPRYGISHFLKQINETI